MAETRERRQVERLPVPPHLCGPEREARQMCLFDLSPNGARIEHFLPLEDWSMCFLDLPQALGGARLQGEVVWSRVGEGNSVIQGEWPISYQSGLTFKWLTPDQRAALAAALKILDAARGPAA